jgi:hypothetical protein
VPPPTFTASSSPPVTDLPAPPSLDFPALQGQRPSRPNCPTDNGQSPELFIYKREEHHGSKKLKGRRIAVLATDGFEKVELTIPAAALRSAGAEVDSVSLSRGAIRGVNLHKPANKVYVDRAVTEANPADYYALLISGGFINPGMLRHWRIELVSRC